VEATAKLVYRVQSIRNLGRTDRGTAVTFSDGSVGFLDAGHPNYDTLLIHAEHGLRRTDHAPVGVVIENGGHIVDLGTAHDTPVYWVREFPNDPTRFRVAFWAYTPLCALTRDHPEFDRVFRTLTAAAGTPQMVWVVPHSEDTVEDEPDEDGLVSALPKVMDVRPV
jgi:hypothetical protein